jgi:hypothetical protein
MARGFEGTMCWVTSSMSSTLPLVRRFVCPSGFSTSIVGYALGALVVLLLTVGCGAMLMIVTAIRRSRAREQA